MIDTQTYDDVKVIKLARSLDGKTPIYWTAAYLFEGILIDTGCEYTKYELLNEVKNSPIHAIINTHYHEDHIGGNKLLKEKLKVDIFASEKTIKLINEMNWLPEYRIFAWGFPEKVEIRAIGKKLVINNKFIQVIDSPGHSPDHISLYFPENGYLFVGDTFIAKRIYISREEENPYHLLDSLKKFVDLDPSVIFNGSGKVIVNPENELLEAIEYLENLAKEIFSLKDKGLTVDDITSILLKDIPKTSTLLEEISGGEFERRKLVENILTKWGK